MLLIDAGGDGGNRQVLDLGGKDVLIDINQFKVCP